LISGGMADPKCYKILGPSLFGTLFLCILTCLYDQTYIFIEVGSFNYSQTMCLFCDFLHTCPMLLSFYVSTYVYKLMFLYRYYIGVSFTSSACIWCFNVSTRCFDIRFPSRFPIDVFWLRFSYKVFVAYFLIVFFTICFPEAVYIKIFQ
jgi:hypothetical protein